MVIVCKYNYTKDVIPPRCRKPRPKTFQGFENIIIDEITAEEAPSKFIVHSYKEPMVIREYNNKLWKISSHRDYVCRTEGTLPISVMEHFASHCCDSAYFRDIDKCLEEIHKQRDRFLIIDGVVYDSITEPMYQINTFGLGGNHGGTSLSVVHHRNPNIRDDRYYAHDERSLAIADAIKVANDRGDTESIVMIKQCDFIEKLF